MVRTEDIYRIKFSQTEEVLEHVEGSCTQLVQAVIWINLRMESNKHMMNSAEGYKQLLSYV